MKAKLWHALTVGLITLSLFAPATIVGAFIWQRHLQLVAAKQALIPADVQRSSPAQSSLLPTEGVRIDQNWVSFQPINSELFNHTLNRATMAVQQFEMADGIVGFILFMPLGVALGILMHQRYLAYRDATHHRQVATLERLWQRSYRR